MPSSAAASSIIKRTRTPAPKAPERLTEQLVVRVTPSMRQRLDAYTARHGELRGVGDAVRHILDSCDWR